MSLRFSSVFPSNAFQNIHKHVTIFLTQQHFVMWFVLLGNHAILHTFVISKESPPCVINMKIFFHVWNLMKFKREKYNWGSLPCFTFVLIIKRQSRTVLSSVLILSVAKISCNKVLVGKNCGSRTSCYSGDFSKRANQLSWL